MGVFNHLPHPGNLHNAWIPVNVVWGCGHKSTFYTNQVLDAEGVLHVRECCSGCVLKLINNSRKDQ